MQSWQQIVMVMVEGGQACTHASGGRCAVTAGRLCMRCGVCHFCRQLPRSAWPDDEGSLPASDRPTLRWSLRSALLGFARPAWEASHRAAGGLLPSR